LLTVNQELLWLKTGDSLETQRKENDVVGVRHQRTDEETADRKDRVRTVANLRMYELTIAP
jgi:hypothetical protein